MSVDGVEDRAELTLVPNLPQITASISPEEINTTTKVQWSMLAKDGSGAMLNNLEMNAHTNVGRMKVGALENIKSQLPPHGFIL